MQSDAALSWPAGLQRCDMCGTANELSRTFCLNCGAQLKRAGTTTSAALAVAKAQEERRRGMRMVGYVVGGALLFILAAAIGFVALGGLSPAPAAIVLSESDPSQMGDLQVDRMLFTSEPSGSNFGRRLYNLGPTEGKTDTTDDLGVAALQPNAPNAIYVIRGRAALPGPGIVPLAFDPAVVTRSGVFSPPERVAFPNTHRLDLDGLIGRARSASYVPKSGPEGGRLLNLLRALHAAHADADGFVTMIYETEVYRAAKL